MTGQRGQDLWRARNLIEWLRRLGSTVWIENGRVAVFARFPVSGELAATIRDLKPHLLHALRTEEREGGPTC